MIALFTLLGSKLFGKRYNNFLRLLRQVTPSPKKRKEKEKK